MNNDCWNQTGVQGDRTCPELKTVIHCQNCAVYSRAGRGLLDRAAPAEYITEWTKLLAQPRAQDAAESTVVLSVALFRLRWEWLALPSRVLRQVLPPNPVHTLPHRSDRILRGIVNVRGQLLLCVALQELLGLATESAADDRETLKRQPGSYPRLVVIAQGSDVWTFEADEFYGLHRCSPQEIHPSPTHANRILATFTQNIVHWQDRYVSYLDSDRLFEALQQTIL